MIIYFTDKVLRAALSLYMEDIDLPMPTPEEMLICNQHTTAEEVCTYIHNKYNIRILHLIIKDIFPYVGNHSVAKSSL